jgi:hypothetical protein
VLARAFLVVSLVAFTGCTYVNRATFAIDSQRPAATDDVLRGIENYFASLGIKLERKTEFIYPKSRTESSYFLGRTVGPIPLHSSYHHVVLRLEAERLYIDWIEISDVRRPPRAEPFAQAHAHIAADLKKRLGVDVVFRLMENE